MPLDQPAVTEGPALATAEFAPSTKQTLAIQTSCIANALTGINGLSTAEKEQLRIQVKALQANLSTAIDLVKKRQARMTLQKKRLADERALIGDSQSNFSKFYAVAARAVANCDTAAKAAQDAKSGVDMVFSKETEIKYREGLLSSLETELNTTLSDYESAMDVLDTMVLAIS